MSPIFYNDPKPPVLDDSTDHINTNLLTEQSATIYVTGGSTAQTPASAGVYEDLTLWATDGVEKGADANQANNKIIARTTGVYEASYRLAFTSSAAAIWNARVTWNGVAQAASVASFQVVAGMGRVQLVCPPILVDVTTKDTDFKVQILTGTASAAMTLIEGALTIKKVGVM